MPPDTLARLDAALGDGLEALVAGHHRRRLRRHGHAGALDPAAGGWATSDPPPRDGNRLEVLVDGAAAVPAIAEAIRGARSHVYVAGWHIDPRFRMGHDGPAVRDVLADAAERVPVRVLVWAGAPVPVMKPARGAVRKVQRELQDGTRIRV